MASIGVCVLEGSSDVRGTVYFEPTVSKGVVWWGLGMLPVIKLGIRHLNLLAPQVL